MTFWVYYSEKNLVLAKKQMRLSLFCFILAISPAFANY